MGGVLFAEMVLQILSAATRKHTMEEQNILRGRGKQTYVWVAKIY